jgi:hypothetical protein
MCALSMSLSEGHVCGRRLGLGGKLDQLMDTSEVVRDEDLMPAVKGGGQAETQRQQTEASELLSQMEGMFSVDPVPTTAQAPCRIATHQGVFFRVLEAESLRCKLLMRAARHASPRLPACGRRAADHARARVSVKPCDWRPLPRLERAGAQPPEAHGKEPEAHQLSAQRHR